MIIYFVTQEHIQWKSTLQIHPGQTLQFQQYRKARPQHEEIIPKGNEKAKPAKIEVQPMRSLPYLNPVSGPNYKFTNIYYSRVLSGESVLGVDQRLQFGMDTKQISKEFAEDRADFRSSFALSISPMGGRRVLTGDKGQIFLNCRYVNKK
ncbi:peroxidase superfamily protein [Actinidia rufa]|uniref:Peroxidase superfamily protein n=1 Tax=Actinidia rufa TaxID=165716 RepID=A0A7J0F251_9ERIC|nr:peroxidase superfamily protein [Actinidia rufa]